MFACKATAGLIKPAILPPTEGAAACTAFSYEPVPTLDPMAPEELPVLWFMRAVIVMEIAAQHCSCKKNSVQCISACRHYMQELHQCDDAESREDSDIDF